MIELSDVSLNRIIIHRVGNKLNNEGYFLSEEGINLKEHLDLAGVLNNYFLPPFENLPLYNFTHTSSLELNEVYSLVTKIFGSIRSFENTSKEISKILYEYSMHPKVKGGDLYVAHFKNCILDGQAVDAVGIFKSENKETFLKLKLSNHNYIIDYEDGTNINKLDKGCLILNTNKENGYVVCVVDHTNKSSEAQYWKDEFLKIQPSGDDYHTTQKYLDVCKNFVANQLEQEYEVNKTDKIDFLNKTVDYFKKNAVFNENEFLGEVFEDKEVIKSFKSFKEEYVAENNFDLNDEFEISGTAVKKQARVFKSVLKLDKNFHVYIHGDKSLIEKGYDDKVGKSYYKIFFDTES